MSPDTTTSLRMTRLVPADPGAVFAAWTELERMKRWMCPEGGVVAEAEADPSVGGRYRIVMRFEDAEHVATGTYRVVEPPRRLAFTWGWEGEDASVGPGESLVTVEFHDREGATEVELVHERLPSAESRDSHEEGWTSSLTRLEALFA